MVFFKLTRFPSCAESRLEESLGSEADGTGSARCWRARTGCVSVSTGPVWLITGARPLGLASVWKKAASLAPQALPQTREAGTDLSYFTP